MTAHVEHVKAKFCGNLQDWPVLKTTVPPLQALRCAVRGVLLHLRGHILPLICSRSGMSRSEEGTGRRLACRRATSQQVAGAVDTHLRVQGRSKKVSIMLGNTLSDELRGHHCENFGPPVEPPTPRSFNSRTSLTKYLFYTLVYGHQGPPPTQLSGNVLTTTLIISKVLVVSFVRRPRR